MIQYLAPFAALLALTACTAEPDALVPVRHAPLAPVSGVRQLDLGAAGGASLTLPMPGRGFATQATVDQIDHFQVILTPTGGTPFTTDVKANDGTACLKFSHVPCGLATLKILAMSGTSDSTTGNLTLSVSYTGGLVTGIVDTLTAKLDVKACADDSVCATVKLVPTVDNGNGMEVGIHGQNGDSVHGTITATPCSTLPCPQPSPTCTPAPHPVPGPSCPPAGEDDRGHHGD